MRWLLLAACLACAAATMKGASESDKNKFLVLRAFAMNESHVVAMKKLQLEGFEHDLDFWKSPTKVGQFADIMVPETGLPWLERQLRGEGIEWKVTIPDVQRLILERENKPKPDLSLLPPGIASFFRRFKDATSGTSNRARYPWGEYHSYERIQQWMNDIESFYPQHAKVITIGTTHEGRPIKGIKIGDPRSSTRRVVWIDGGIHAREWAAVHTALWFIDQLIGGKDTDPTVSALVRELNFYIIPVLNPDGYEYSRSDISPMTRLWRKNRANIVCKKDHWFRDRCCGGVDLNRNFDFHWGEVGSSTDRCSEIYNGERAFSEPESRAVRDMILGELRGRVDAFITLHTYSQMWIHPFSHARKSVPNDIADILSVGRRGVDALASVYGTQYRFGTGADILYPSSGGSDDWAKGKGGAKFVYLLELRPNEDVWDGFLLDPRELIPTGKETWEGVKVVFKEVLNRKRGGVTGRTAPRVNSFDDMEGLASVAMTSSTTTTTTTTTPPTTLPVEATSSLVFWITSTPPPGFIDDDAVAMPRQQQQHPQRIAPVVRVQQPRVEDPRIAQQRESMRLAQQRRLQMTSRRRNNSLRVTSAPAAAVNGQCADRSPWCAAWLRNNPAVCQVSSIYMSRDCARTCRFCR